MSELKLEHLQVHYRDADEPTLKGVSLRVGTGERVALVGESGSGKSTLAKALLGLAPVVGGQVFFDGRKVVDERGAEAGEYRQRVQMIFQDPYNSLHPRMSVMQNLMEPLKIHGLYSPRESREKGRDLLLAVGLDPDSGGRYPHQFSGGQLQRIGIARALLTEPALLLADEPVSALDVSVQAQVLNLLEELSRSRGLGLLMVSHDLAVVRQLCERVAVMFQGRLVEVGPVEEVCFRPRHPYTRTLVQATLGREVELPASPLQGGREGCPFVNRCTYRQDICGKELPLFSENPQGHGWSCHVDLGTFEGPSV